MNDDKLNFKVLPTTLLLSGFVNGDEDSNYEKYLLQFVNSSSFFMDKSKGQRYSSPIKEDSGECDCNSDTYKLDFKLLISGSLANSKRDFSKSIKSINQGVYAYGIPKVYSKPFKAHEASATVLHTWFRSYTGQQLISFPKGFNRDETSYKDIRNILKALDKPKNILCFLPYEYCYSEKEDYKEQEESIINRVGTDYQSLIQYRYFKQPKYDVYISFVFGEYFIILQFNIDGVYNKVDTIKIERSSVFIKLRELNK